MFIQAKIIFEEKNRVDQELVVVVYK